MTRVQQDTSAEELNGGNLHVRFRGRLGWGHRSGLLNKTVQRNARTRGVRVGRAVLWTILIVIVSVSYAASQAVYAASGSRPKFFSKPVLVKNSPTNLKYFDVSWVDQATQRYYLSDRNNDAVDLVDAATDTFIGFIGKGHYTGARTCPGEPKQWRLCAGPNGVITDDVGHVWAGNGNGDIIEASATRSGSTIIRSIPTGGTGRIDEFAYDPVSQILMAENDGSFPPYITFFSPITGRILSQYFYPKGQRGMEQPVWDPRTGLFYQNVPGKHNRIDVFDPGNLTRPVKSIPVECHGGLFGLTLAGLTVGPNGMLMAVCGTVGGALIDPVTGKMLKVVPQGGDADQVWFDSGTDNYFFSGPRGVAVVSAATLKYVTTIPLVSHSVAVDAQNHHVFVPVAGKGIYVLTFGR